MDGNTERSSLTISSVITGSLLGDGSIEKNHKWIFAESHTERQKDYLLWKANAIPSCNVSVFNRSFGTVYRLRTAQDPIYETLRKKWYPNGKKIIPKNLMEEMDDVALAVWYFDDGDKVNSSQTMKYLAGTTRRNLCRISAAGFTYKENLYLRRILHKKFGILPDVVKEKSGMKSYYRLYFRKENFDKLMAIVKKVFVELQLPEAMRYKIGERVESRRGITQRIILEKGLIPRNNGRFVSKRCAPNVINI